MRSEQTGLPGQFLPGKRSDKKRGAFEVALGICAVLVLGFTALCTIGALVGGAMGMWAEDTAEARQEAVIGCMFAGTVSGFAACAVFAVRTVLSNLSLGKTSADKGKIRGGVDFAAGAALLAACVFQAVYFALRFPSFSFWFNIFCPAVLAVGAALLLVEGTALLARARREGGGGRAA